MNNGTTAPPRNGRPSDVHGWLRVQGTRVVDRIGQPVQLRGMSLFWSQWMSKYWNAQTIDWLVNDWKSNVVRAAVGVETIDEVPGYLLDPEGNFALLSTVVEAALERGIYVIIDWHDHRASQHLDASLEFFEKVARRWGHRPEVIFEIYNEPETDTWPQVKEYSRRVIQVIRRWAPKSLIIVGTARWSQEVDQAAADPVEGENLAYAIHFYAATHGDFLREKARTALRAGLALFCSEWGASEASGNGRIDLHQTQLWLDLLDAHGISWCNWSLADKVESSAALVPGACPTGAWPSDDLTPSGKYVRAVLRR